MASCLIAAAPALLEPQQPLLEPQQPQRSSSGYFWPRNKKQLGSQGEQDGRLARILHALSLDRNGTFVEFGFNGRAGSNTEALERRGWTGFRMDGSLDRPSESLHKEWITSTTVVSLFRKYRVPPDITYVSIDLDSADIWIMKALLASEFQPSVLTIEYNPNFPHGFPLAFPDPATTHVKHAGWDGDCYYGSSAMAIELAAREMGYVVADVEPGLDLFLVRSSLWGSRPTPSLGALPALHRPFNIGFYGRPHRAMSADKAAGYLDYPALMRNGSVAYARQMAALQIARLRAAGVACFVDPPCADDALVTCPLLFSKLCPSPGGGNPCVRYPPSSDDFPLAPFSPPVDTPETRYPPGFWRRRK